MQACHVIGRKLDLSCSSRPKAWSNGRSGLTRRWRWWWMHVRIINHLVWVNGALWERLGRDPFNTAEEQTPSICSVRQLLYWRSITVEGSNLTGFCWICRFWQLLSRFCEMIQCFYPRAAWDFDCEEVDRNFSLSNKLKNTNRSTKRKYFI